MAEKGEDIKEVIPEKKEENLLLKQNSLFFHILLNENF
jgi:hypothetical protein